ncbi:MAG TPA: hypothetical protein VKA46_20270 [Gemmataceae bacterium]|nr:hypothetical protein [Gemmataceae bacterium]
MIELTPEQRQRLESGEAVAVTDAETATPYVVLRKDVYDRVRNLLYDDSEATHDELRAMLARSSAANGWDEPDMDAYDRYDDTVIKLR